MRQIHLWKAGRRVKGTESLGPLKGMTSGSRITKWMGEGRVWNPDYQTAAALSFRPKSSLPARLPFRQARKRDCAQDHLWNICRDECQVQYILKGGWGLYKLILLSFNNGDSNTFIFNEYGNSQDWYQKEHLG